jgi:hypothetical protein
MNKPIPPALERLYSWIAEHDRDLDDALEWELNHNQALVRIAQWYNLSTPNPMKPLAYRAEKLLLAIQRQWDDGK